MNEIIKNEIRILYASFDTTNNLYEKGYIMALLDYLQRVMPNDKEIIYMQNDINNKISSLGYEYVTFLLLRNQRMQKLMYENKDFFDNNVRWFLNKEKYPYEYLAPLKQEDISYIIEEFLKSIDVNLLYFYQEMVKEGRIIYSDSNNIANTSLYNSKTIILVEGLRNLRDIMVFLHELGHTYYIYLNNSLIRERDDITVEMKDEIPAKIMEAKFIKFLKDKGLKKQVLILEDFLYSIIYECHKKRDNYENMKYLIASDIALKLKDVNINLTKYYKYIYESDLFELIKENNSKKRIGRALRK